ncbi:MAG: hypothetical protein ACOC91_03725, partial [bacterium]
MSMFGKPSQKSRDADPWQTYPSGKEDKSEDLDLDEFPPPFRRKPFTWTLAKLGLVSPDPEKQGKNELDEGDIAEQTLLVRKALERIEASGFYTLDAVRQLAVEHFRKKAEAFAQLAEEANRALVSGRLSPEKRREFVEKQNASAKFARTSRSAEGLFKNRSLTDRMKRLMEGKPHPFPSYVLPGKRTIRLLFQFFRESG